MLDALLVTLALVDLLLGLLGLSNGLLNGRVPTVALGVVSSLESVLLVVSLEGEFVGRVLLEVGHISEEDDILGVALLALGLDEVEETLAGLAGPGGDWVGDLGFGATEVVAQRLGRDGLVTEPEVAL